MKTAETTLRVLRDGAVTRYHATPGIPPQPLSEHQWGVAVIYLYLTGSDRWLPSRPLFHDQGEAYTGDVPFNVKRDSPQLKKLLDELEDRYLEEVGLPTHTTVDPVLKVADYLEGLAYCCKQVRQGNTRAIRVAEAFTDGVRIWHSSIRPGEEARARTVTLLNILLEELG